MSFFPNRRDLLRSSASLAAASLLPRAIAAAPQSATPPRIRLGIASYTFRSFDSAHLIDFMHRLRCSNLNLKDVHLPFVPADTVATRAAVYTAAGFRLTAAGNISFAKEKPDDMRAKFLYARAAGIPIMVCTCDRETLPLLDALVKEFDIRLAIHNHGPEDHHFPSPLDALAAIKNLDPRIGCCIDVGHTMRAGTDVPAAIRAVGPRLFDVHMKDLADATSKESQVAVGAGIMPIREIFQALLDIHYPGSVDLEYEIFATDPFPGVQESFAYMRGVLAGMGHPEWGFNA